jgi:putative glycerol-1-phosphate prenyltransferase
MKILKLLRQSRSENKKLLAVLIDPDKVKDAKSAKELMLRFESCNIDIYLIGGSLLTSAHMPELIGILKASTRKPVVIFPGSQLHIHGNADGILLLSLISGRNAELLIGKHVEAAPYLKKSAMELLPTGYLLIGDSNSTTVAYISQTTPIPYSKSDIAVCTAMAGEMLGLSLIYLDAGSGAKQEVPPSMIREVKKSIDIPLIAGGGIDTPEKATAAWNAGADMIVIGTAIEKDPQFVEQIINVREQLHVHQ